MTHGKSMQMLHPDDSQKLHSLLQNEDQQYRRLLRLAWRQNAYLRRQDVERLEKNAAEWRKYLPEANAVRDQRVELVRTLGDQMGVGPTTTSPGKLLEYAAPPAQRTIKDAVATLLKTTTELARQNELNRSLAEFCLDLAREEATIFKEYITADPSGCYGDDAQKATAGPGGVLVKQA